MRNGFTLIEITIAFIIIGLVTSGIVLGRDMIGDAKVRGTIAQFKSYSTAALVFQDRYGGLPGDLEKDTAMAFGFIRGNGSTARNGDGYIETSYYPSDRYLMAIEESYCVWKDLSQANLIDFKPAAVTYEQCGNFSYGDEEFNVHPYAKIGYKARIIPFTDYNKNFFAIDRHSFSYLSDFTTWGSVIPPSVAFTFDIKIDDGLPLTGAVRGTDPFNAGWDVGSGGVYANAIPDTPAPGVCVSDATDNPYNLVNGEDVAACGLRIDAGF